MSARSTLAYEVRVNLHALTIFSFVGDYHKPPDLVVVAFSILFDADVG